MSFVHCDENSGTPEWKAKVNQISEEGQLSQGVTILVVVGNPQEKGPCDETGTRARVF